MKILDHRLVLPALLVALGVFPAAPASAGQSRTDVAITVQADAFPFDGVWRPVASGRTDATGAYITRNPEGLARALEKLAGYSGQRLEVSEGVRHMFIINPAMELGGEGGLFSTHPSIAERIKRLRSM